MQYLPTPYQEYIHQSKYARWDDDKNRRETHEESIDRYMDQITRQAAKFDPLSPSEQEFLSTALLELDAMGSMRALMTAGKALERDNVAGYNCAYVAVDDPRAFDETLYILCCGTGIGFSVERQYVEQLPSIPSDLHHSIDVIVVPDSKEGWADSLRQLISSLYDGKIPSWDTSLVRPEGQRLKTFGGRSSGPGPLIALFEYVVEIFKGAAGRQLNTRESHGIMCKIGDIVVVGGVRRSALISLSDPDDEEMRDLKSGAWWESHPEYRLANNSAVWADKPERHVFDTEWQALRDSGSGERGFINRKALTNQVASLGTRDPKHLFGVNPCSEIILRKMQFCNLTTIVVRKDDDFATLARKAKVATMLGVIQSTFTDFRYLRDEWRQNCEEERLLGVSMTGQADHPILNGSLGRARKRELLAQLREVVHAESNALADRFGINRPTAACCVKPEGTGSQKVKAPSGMSDWWSELIIRRTRGSKLDPVSQFLYSSGVPAEDDVMNPSDWVFSWPIAAPEGATTRHDRTAIEQLEHWLDYQEAWCDHKPSITVNIKEHEWDEVADWVYEHFDRMSGVAFLPWDDHTYKQMPYEEATPEQFAALEAQMPELDWSVLAYFETYDQTESSHELACVAGGCAI
jgi:ribonucleoside-triphosphate reductase